jgi:hypothetical protein
MEGAVEDHDVVFGDDLVDLPAPVRERRLEHAQGPGHAVQPLRRAGRAVVVDEVGGTTSASAATSPRGKISPRVRRAIALMSWEMRCSIERSCLLVVNAAWWDLSSAVTERGPQRLQKRFRSLRHHEVAGVLDHVQRPAVADAGLSGPGWHLVEEVVFVPGVITE